ncbi:MAG: ABC transporter permease [Planctomycetota bacterium]|nr:ABC transporter permease [Planctomycetota bacterium]
MGAFKLVTHSLKHYWRTNVAVLLGVIAGTAVIGGALVVGDSVRESLRKMSLDRLGEIDHVVHGPRFFREQLADELAADDSFSARFDTVAPALVLRGSLQHDEFGDVRRANRVNVYALDERLWGLTQHGDLAVPQHREDESREVVLCSRVAEQLAAVAGDRVALSVELPSNIPRDSILGERDELSKEIVFTVKAVLPEDMGLGRLDLNPNQQLPLNAYVPLDTLQGLLDLAEVVGTPRNPVSKPARVNALFVKAKSEADRTGATAADASVNLTQLIAEHIALDDLGIRVVPNQRFDYLSVESSQMVLERAFEDAAAATAKELGLKTSPALVYLANEIAPIGFELNEDVATTRKNLEQPGYAMYSVIGGLEIASDDAFGIWDVVSKSNIEGGGSMPLALTERQIVINDFLQRQLAVNVGDKLRVKYHVVGSHGELPEETLEFEVAAVVKLDGAAADRGITPEVDGVTNVATFEDWDKPFSMKTNWLTQQDRDYWGKGKNRRPGPLDHRATPKAFVSLATAQKHWTSRYGRVTSFRVSLPGGDNPQATFTTALLKQIQPEATGLAAQPIKWSGLQAAVGANDFSGLFFGFSFFLILSATILIGLLFRLGVERRASEVGLLSAVGMSMQRVGRLFLIEGLVVVLVGGVIGVGVAIGYASLMVYGLKTWWIGAIGTKFLYVFIKPASLVTGFGIAVVIMVLVIWRSLRQLRLVSTRELLTGNATAEMAGDSPASQGRTAGKTAKISTGIAVACLAVGFIPGLAAKEAFGGFSIQVVVFFLVGVSLLVASLSSLSAWLDADRSAAVRGRGIEGVRRLGVRNAARNRRRSVLTAALIASATFVIVAVAAGHRNPVLEQPDLNTGNGGFSLVAESSQPVLFDMNTTDGREKLEFRTDDAPDAELIDRMQVMPFRVKPGEDASCLNLYQTRVPTILGVPPQMYERGGFKFADTRAADPWALLKDVTYEEANGGRIPIIPVLGDLNTLQYSLKKGIDSVISVPDETAPQYKLKVVGMFDASVFQGVLLMDGTMFDQVFTDQPVGDRYFLVDVAQQRDFVASESDRKTRRTLEAELADTRSKIATTSKARTTGTIAAIDPESNPQLKALIDQRDKLLTQIRQLQSPTDRLSTILETDLSAFGFDVEPVSVRLAAFLAVQNTYLSTFQTLGGLGLLLGTLGLATVMLRNVLERRSELALMRAIGFRNRSLAWLVLFENALLLLWGLTAGAIAALLAMGPHLLTTGADIPWRNGGITLALVVLVGMTAALAAVREAVRTPILSTLRAE